MVVDCNLLIDARRLLLVVWYVLCRVLFAVCGAVICVVRSLLSVALLAV